MGSKPFLPLKKQSKCQKVCLLLVTALAVLLNLPGRMLKFGTRHMYWTIQRWMDKTLILLIPLLWRVGEVEGAADSLHDLLEGSANEKPLT